MNLSEFFNQLVASLSHTGPLEFLAVVAGITSVWFNWKENILGYPIGLFNTVFYIYFSIKGGLFGEASVNLYYTIVSIYGWILWAKKDKEKHETVLHITFSTRKDWVNQLLFFSFFYIVIFAALTWAKKAFAPEAIPWADAFAAATAYTGMWLLAKKKVENWLWWIATNIVSIPLWFVKGSAFTSLQFVILLILAFAGLASWRKKGKEYRISNTKFRM